MSGIAKAVKKVAKGVGGFVKKFWKPLAIAAAVYFTAGAASSLFGGGGLLGGATTAATEGATALGEAGTALAGAGEAAAGIGGAAAAATEAAAPWMSSLTSMGLADAGATAASGGLLGGIASGAASVASSGLGDAVASAASGGGPSGFGSIFNAAKGAVQGVTSSVGKAASSVWNGLTDGKGLSGLLNNRGAMDLIGGGIKMYAQSEMMNNAEKYKTERAPFQLGKGSDFSGAYNLSNNSSSPPIESNTQAPLSNSSMQAMGAANTPFSMATTQLPQQQGVLNYMQHVPSFMEGPYGDQSIYS